MNRQDVNVLLLQLRNEQIMIKHERDCIIRSGGLGASQLTTVDGLQNEISWSDLEGKQAFIVGATGDYSIFDDIKVKPSLMNLLNRCREENFPVLGICWGSQFMVDTFGGTVVTDPSKEEVGSYIIFPLSEAKNDPLFFDAPDTFWAQVIHHESITSLPEGAVRLLRSDRCPAHAFTWPGSAQYGIQLHPELSKNELIERVTHYRDVYAADPALLNAIIDNAKDSIYTDDLVAKFIDRVVLPRWA